MEEKDYYLVIEVNHNNTKKSIYYDIFQEKLNQARKDGYEEVTIAVAGLEEWPIYCAVMRLKGE